MPIKHRCC